MLKNSQKLKINKEHIKQIEQSWSSQYGDSYQEGLHFLIEHLPSISKSVEEIVDEISTNKPVQQIIGEWPFYHGTYVINENVLIPRPETEVMIDHIIKSIKSCKSVLDLGTGSGCIAIELSKIFSSACVHAVDKSVQALEVAKKNNHQTPNKVKLYHSDWFSNIEQKFNLIVSNPPYVAHEIATDKSLTHEPNIALYAKNEGMFDIEHIISNAKVFLEQGGYLYIVHGQDQKNKVQKLMGKNGFREIKTHKDLSGKERFSFALL